jgi:hypothetical protein
MTNKRIYKDHESHKESMITSLLISLVSAQAPATNTTAPILFPTLPPACLAVLDAQMKPLEANCGSSIPTANVQMQQLVSQLERSCAKACIDGVTAAITRASTAPECSSVPDFASYTSTMTLGTSVMCVKTADDKGFCFAEQLKEFPELGKAADPTSLIATQLGNTKFLCTDCFQKQVRAVAASGLIPGEFRGIVSQLDANLAETCRPSGGIKVLGSTRSSAVTMTGVGAFAAAAAVLVL